MRLSKARNQSPVMVYMFRNILEKSYLSHSHSNQNQATSVLWNSACPLLLAKLTHHALDPLRSGFLRPSSDPWCWKDHHQGLSTIKPSIPVPTSLVSNEHFQEATKNVEATLNTSLATRMAPNNGPGPFNQTSFSIRIFSTTEKDLLYEFHYTDASAKQLDGHQKCKF